MSEEQAKRRGDERNTRETTTTYIEMKWVQQIPAVFSLSLFLNIFLQLFSPRRWKLEDRLRL